MCTLDNSDKCHGNYFRQQGLAHIRSRNDRCVDISVAWYILKDAVEY